MNGPVVIKVGGSLEDRLGQLCGEILQAGRPALIVPGGGRFADRVRDINPSPDAAHWMAVAAMEQYGWYISSFGIPWTESVEIPAFPSVLLPYRALREHDPLPHTWDVTSDTIAAWIAATLSIPLVLAKSVDGITDSGGLIEELKVPIETDVVDPGFLEYVTRYRLNVTILNGSVPGRVFSLLIGDCVKGTVIGDLLSGHRTRL
jgi:5-(aminomethyl)-3-furanmethanol phosphate kinase